MEDNVRTLIASVDVNLFLDANDASDDSLGRPQSEKTSLTHRQGDEKQREIDRLHAVIEAMSPIPGYDYDKVRRLIIEKGDEIDIDHRDAKIVSLAKKCRNLTVQVNKLSAENENQHQSIRDLNSMCNNLRAEVALARSSSMGNSSSSADIVDSKELINANKMIEELRRKYLSTKEESKNLRNALTRELGEGVSLDQALDGNWRGRAQTIIMLKSKIKRLESQLQQGLKADVEISSTIGSTNSRDVDAKADRNIADIDYDKKQLLDKLNDDYKRLNEDYSELESKYTSSRSRIKNLEADNQKVKQQMQIVLDKTSSDDELIDALKEEIERLKKTIRDVRTSNSMKAENNADMKKTATVRSTSGDTSMANVTVTSTTMSNDDATRRLNNEITRLERICKSQSQQLSTQDSVIRELRAQVLR